MLNNSGLRAMKTGNDLIQHTLEAGNQMVEHQIRRKAIMENHRIESLLSPFNPHRLDDLNTAGLMNRVDTKYLLPIRDLEKLLGILTPWYSVLEINFSRLFHYETTYFDTPGFGFYLMHHNGKQNRVKLRHRLYVESGDRYAEVKHKTNKGVTQKDRIRINTNGSRNNGFNEAVSERDEEIPASLFPSLMCSYVRIAMTDRKKEERLTLDFDLSFNDPAQATQNRLDYVLIAELKRKHRKSPSRFLNMMNQFKYKPVSFSKYCIGCALLYSGAIKTNRFKPALIALDRIAENLSGKQTLKQNLWQ